MFNSQYQAKCTALVVIRARMSDLLWEKGAKVWSAAKREQLHSRRAWKFLGLHPLPVIKTRGNPILSQGKSHIRLS